jgi:hypothetical protein
MATVDATRLSAGEAAVNRLSWGALFGGVAVSLGVWMLLYVFGLAIGLTSIDPNNPSSLKGAGIGTGIWALIAPLIALFIGGMVTSRVAGLIDRTSGGIHGAVLWGLTSIAGFFVLTSVLSTLLGGAMKLGGEAVSAAAHGVSAAAGKADTGSLQALGIDANDLLGPVNQRLRAAGKPPVTADQLQAASKDVIGTAVREGRFDRELLVTSIAQNTALSRADAEDIAGRVETQFNARKGQFEQKAQNVGQNVQTGALKAAESTGKVFWGLSGVLFLGFISAVLGAMTGVGKRQRAAATRALELRGRTEREVYP